MSNKNLEKLDSETRDVINYLSIKLFKIDLKPFHTF